MATSHPYLRRTTTSVLAAVALISGAILLLGDRFDAARGDVVGQTVQPEARIAACVADESMRLINPAREQCKPGERELVSEHSPAAAGAGEAGGAGAGPNDGRGVPAGIVSLVGRVLPDPEAAAKSGTPEDRMELVVSAPRLPGGDPAGSGWTATVRNTSGTAPLAIVVAAICLALRYTAHREDRPEFLAVRVN